jgi:hypothetical protein
MCDDDAVSDMILTAPFAQTLERTV